MSKIIAIGFFANSKTQLNALKDVDWCDTYFVPTDQKRLGIPGTVDGVKKLNINFGSYNAAITWGDGLSPAQKYFYEQCFENEIPVISNQHGFNKSIFQIVKNSPNPYCKYWNSMGMYMLDRFKDVVGKEAISRRWISEGSLLHDYLHNKYKWRKDTNNGKAMVIHEPDLKMCEGDPHPHASDSAMDLIIKTLNDCGIDADLKVHPNWKNFIGNAGELLRRPQKINIVDIDVEKVVDYALVIGSRSSLLLDAVAMGVPTVALKSKSSWKDDKYAPTEEGLIPVYSTIDLKEGIIEHFNNEPSYDVILRDYYLGPLGKVRDNYRRFILYDLENPRGTLGTYFNEWQRELKMYGTLHGRIIRKLKNILEYDIKKFRFRSN